MANRSATPERLWTGPAMYLAAAAGAADVFGFLKLGQVFTSAMTGNTALLAIALAQGQVVHATRSAVALLAFVLGAAMGAVLLDRVSRFRRGGWPALTVVELLVLLAFAAAWAAGRPVLPDSTYIASLAIAMGMQSTTARRLGVPGVMTTFFTGTLTTLVTGLVDRESAGPLPVRRRDAGRQLLAFALYAAGAALTAGLLARAPDAAAAIPAAAALAALLSRRDIPPVR